MKVDNVPGCLAVGQHLVAFGWQLLERYPSGKIDVCSSCWHGKRGGGGQGLSWS